LLFAVQKLPKNLSPFNLVIIRSLLKASEQELLPRLEGQRTEQARCHRICIL